MELLEVETWTPKTIRRVILNNGAEIGIVGTVEELMRLRILPWREYRGEWAFIRDDGSVWLAMSERGALFAPEKFEETGHWTQKSRWQIKLARRKEPRTDQERKADYPEKRNGGEYE